MLEPQSLPGRYGRVVRAVDHLLTAVDCAAVLTGGWAVWRHGFVGRVTQDLDIVLPTSQLAAFLQAATLSGFIHLPQQPDRWPKLQHKDTGIEIDVLPEERGLRGRTRRMRVRAGQAAHDAFSPGFHVALADPTQPKVEMPCVVFDTSAGPVTFANGIREGEQQWLLSWLSHYLKTLRATVDTENDDPRLPPSNSPISCREESDALVFTRAGRWLPAFVLGFGLVPFFMIAICVGILTLAIRDGELMAALPVFLFLGLGVLLLGIWVVSGAAAPLWRLHWIVHSDEAVCRYLFLGIGVTRRYALPASPVLRIEHQGYGPELEWQRNMLNPVCPMSMYTLSRSEGEFALSLQDIDGVVRALIDRLTEGEARWMMHRLCEAFPSWSVMDIRQ